MTADEEAQVRCVHACRRARFLGEVVARSGTSDHPELRAEVERRAAQAADHTSPMELDRHEHPLSLLG